MNVLLVIFLLFVLFVIGFVVGGTVAISTAPPCPQAYGTVKNMDSPSNDIEKHADLNGNIDALKALCTANSECKGFNAEGWLKKDIIHPLKPLAGNAIYFKV